MSDRTLRHKKILIIVAHSDDEAIGMGGAICKHIEAGHAVSVISMTDGVGSRQDASQKAALNRSKCATNSSKVLGYVWHSMFDFPDNRMDHVALLDVVKRIENVKDMVKPDIVYTHSSADLNIDHQVVNKAVLTAFRPQPGEFCKEIRTFEVASASEYGDLTAPNRFSPNLFIDIAKYWDLKEEALLCYSEELRNYPHSRSVNGLKNLAMRRGNQVGLHMAEAFQVIRRIED
jgi:LmbE family N-acetylglucosaminyl deacetylase